MRGEMMARPLQIAALAMAFAASSSPLWAQGTTTPSQEDDKRKHLFEAIERDPSLSPELKKALKEYLDATKTQPAPSPSTWDTLSKNLKLYGDLRLRAEFDRDRDSQPNRNRERLRGRLGLDYALADELTVGARLVTHERVTAPDTPDPNSTHVTLGRGFDVVGFELDRLYARYRPKWLEGAWLQVGKFNHPFKTTSIYPELVWDQDVQPEGVAGGYTFKDISGWLTSVDIMAAEYVTIEQNLLDEGSAFAAQVTANLSWSDSDKTFLSLGYYKWSNVTPDGSTLLFMQNAGNSVLAGDFESEFEIVHVLLGSSHKLWNVPLSLGVEYWKNLDAAIDDDQGWAVGAAVGQLKEQWDWRFYVQYQVVEQDSVFSSFAQDDFLLQTNLRGIVAGAQLVVMKNVDVHAWVLTSARERPGTTATTDDDDDQIRFRIDINIKF